MFKRSHSLGAGGRGGKGLDVTMRQLNNIFICTFTSFTWDAESRLLGWQHLLRHSFRVTAEVVVIKQ